MKPIARGLIAIGLLALSAPLWWAWPDIRHAVRMAEPQVITAQVRLVNRCEIAPHNFSVLNTVTGRSTQFSNGMARVKARQGSYLQLQLNARFGDVDFSGDMQRAARHMRMVADCAQGKRMRGLFEGMSRTFGSD